MLIFQNSLITMHYTADNDVLAVEWQNFEFSTTHGIRESIDKIIECIRSYDVCNLLIDTSRSRINLPREDYEALISGFASKLRQTRIKRFARVLSGDPQKEESVRTVRQGYVPPYQFQVFRNQAEGLRWLESQNKRDKANPVG